MQHTGPDKGLKKFKMLTERALMSNIACAQDPSNNIFKKNTRPREYHVGTEALQS